MHFYGRTQMVETEDPVDALTTLAAVGFDGAEICVERKDWSLIPYSRDLALEMKAKAQELGFKSWSFSLHGDYIHDDTHMELTEGMLKLTRSVGTDVFIISGSKPVSHDQEEQNRLIERTKKLVRLAEDEGVRLAMEFEPEFLIGSTDDLLRLMDKVHSPCFGANLDLGHAFLTDPDPMESIATLGQRIFHCHIENMPSGQHRHLLPDDPCGGMDLRVYMEALDEAGFSGGLALDLYHEVYLDVAPKSLKFLRGLI